MTLPEPVAEVVAVAELKAPEVYAVPRSLTFAGVCEAAVHHSPMPMVIHDVEILPGFSVMLCGICADKAVLLALLMDRGERLDYSVSKQFGKPIRAIVEEAFASRDKT